MLSKTYEASIVSPRQDSDPQDMRHIAIAPKQYYPDVELALAYEWKDQMDISSAVINPRAIPQQDIVVEISVPVVVSTPAHDAFIVGAPSVQPHGLEQRSGGGRRRAVGQYGGSRASETAVESGLRWLGNLQSPDGRWDLDGYQSNCQPGRAQTRPGPTRPDGDVLATSGALLAFFAGGYDRQTPSKFRNAVRS